MRISIKAAALLLGAWMLGTTAPAEMFKDGETVVLLGDSITAGGSYQTMISDYYLTRFPDRTIRFVNAGRPGDTAGGSLKRLKEDVIDKRPTAVTIMFGMNEMALELLPIERDLNQEILSVRGLPAGTYELKIDGAVVGHHSAKELECGINLALNEATPQFKQAKAVARFNARRRDAEAQACRLMNTRRWMQSHYKIDPDDPAAVQAHYDTFKDKTEYSAASALTYIKKWSQYGELLKQVAALEKEALAGRKPVPQNYDVCAAR
ncbi:MAG: hypothetical protein IT577_06160 [Verrucomicrobiae bacterium]|nr:hypothetical protein [Verrucomicrobiae bacterium]